MSPASARVRASQGVIKRHGAHRLKETHGTGPVHRHAGSMNAATDPSRIFKGKIGAGHMGVEQVTVQNLDVVKVDPELNMIVVRGAIPGPKGGIVYLKNSVKKFVAQGPRHSDHQHQPAEAVGQRLKKGES